MNNEQKIIKEYMENNELNIEKIVKEYSGYIIKVIKNIYSYFLTEDIEEIVSDAFLVVWKNRDKLDINREIKPYLVGVTKKLILKKYRNNVVMSNIDDFENNLFDNFTIDIEYENNEKEKIILDELYKMKDEDKEIFIEYYFKSKKIKEIARNLKVTEEKAKSRLFRVRKKLKKELEKRGYGNG